jgi:hypothetical protein
MTEDKSISLKGRFPRFFENGFCFDCDDGWFPLIESALLLLNQHAAGGRNQKFKIKQIKEKFGRLRIYTDTNDDYLYGVINTVEHLSLKYCEVCGSSGELRSGNKRVRTLCNFHQNEYLKVTGDPNQRTMDF